MNLIFLGLSADTAYLKSRFPDFNLFVFTVFLKIVQPPKLSRTMGNDFDEIKDNLLHTSENIRLQCAMNIYNIYVYILTNIRKYSCA